MRIAHAESGIRATAVAKHRILEPHDPIASTVSGAHRRRPPDEARQHGERDRIHERLEDHGPPVDAERVST
jgi:hypothetical protein